MTEPPPAPPPAVDWNALPQVGGMPVRDPAEKERMYRERLVECGGGEYTEKPGISEGF